MSIQVGITSYRFSKKSFRKVSNLAIILSRVYQQNTCSSSSFFLLDVSIASWMSSSKGYKTYENISRQNYIGIFTVARSKTANKVLRARFQLERFLSRSKLVRLVIIGNQTPLSTESLMISKAGGWLDGYFSGTNAPAIGGYFTFSDS